MIQEGDQLKQLKNLIIEPDKNLIVQGIKMSVGVVVAIAIATLLKLDYPLSAGVIALLTMLDIKRKSIEIAVTRFSSAIVALLISSLLFSVFGFQLYVLFVFLFIYIVLVYTFNAKAGLIVNTVLVSHLYGDQIVNFKSIINEIGLMFIGIVIALIVQIHVNNMVKDVKISIQELETKMKDIIEGMGHNLNNMCLINASRVTIDELKVVLETGKKLATTYTNNYYIKDTSYYNKYFEMRSKQVDKLFNMERHFNKVIITKDEAVPISEFTLLVAKEFEENNDCVNLLINLEKLRKFYKNSKLPSSREEFEIRASMYQFLNDLEELILIKRDFVKNLI